MEDGELEEYMLGLKIDSSKIIRKEGIITGYYHYRINDNTSDFDSLFGDFVQTLEGYSWIINEDSTHISWNITEEDYEKEPELIDFKDFYEGEFEEFKGYRMYDNSIFRKYLNYVVDDWNRLVCVKDGKGSLAEIVHELNSVEEHEKIRYMDDCIDLLFLNIDGLFWVVFTNNIMLLKKIQEGLIKYEEVIKIEKCNLENYMRFIL